MVWVEADCVIQPMPPLDMAIYYRAFRRLLVGDDSVRKASPGGRTAVLRSWAVSRQLARHRLPLEHPAWQLQHRGLSRFSPTLYAHRNWLRFAFVYAATSNQNRPSYSRCAPGGFGGNSFFFFRRLVTRRLQRQSGCLRPAMVLNDTTAFPRGLARWRVVDSVLARSSMSRCYFPHRVSDRFDLDRSFVGDGAR